MEKEPKDTTNIRRLLGHIATMFPFEGFKQSHVGERGLRARGVLLANPSDKNMSILLADPDDTENLK